MAAGDFLVINGGGPVRRYQAEDRTTSSITTNMLPGEPVKVGGTGTNFVIPLVTGDPEVGTDEFVGIVFSESTETSTADGEVYVRTIIPVKTLMRAKVTTTTNFNTAGEKAGILGDWVACDVTGAGTNGPTGVFTVDENEGTDPNVHGFKVVEGSITRFTVDFIAHAGASEGGPLTGQTMD